MMGLFIGLSSDPLVASETEVRLCYLQHTLLRPSQMNGVAIDTGNIHRFMFAQTPEWHIPGYFMACETLGILGSCIGFSAKDK
jgi:hypothetical protein